MTDPIEQGPPEGEGYDLQAVYAENLKPFWFRWGNRWWQLPHLRMLDFEVQARVESFQDDVTAVGDNVDQLRALVNGLFDMLLGEEQGVEWRLISRPGDAILDMIHAWMKHSGATPGESAASDGSSKSTGRPSKRTSTGTTGSGSRRRSTAKKVAPKPVTAPASS